MNVKFLRAVGVRAHRPGIVAIVDGEACVKWHAQRGWSCDCADLTCGHVDAVDDLLDERVLGEGA